MKPFDYIRAEDTGHATNAAAQGATIIAEIGRAHV